MTKEEYQTLIWEWESAHLALARSFYVDHQLSRAEFDAAHSLHHKTLSDLAATRRADLESEILDGPLTNQ